MTSKMVGYRVPEKEPSEEDIKKAIDAFPVNNMEKLHFRIKWTFLYSLNQVRVVSLENNLDVDFIMSIPTIFFNVHENSLQQKLFEAIAFNKDMTRSHTYDYMDQVDWHYVQDTNKSTVISRSYSEISATEAVIEALGKLNCV